MKLRLAALLLAFTASQLFGDTPISGLPSGSPGPGDVFPFVQGGTTKKGTVAAISSYLVKASNYTAVSGDKLLADTSGGIVTITLPASPSVGDNVEIVDAQGTFGTNTLTVGRNGQSIGGSASDMTASTNNEAFKLVFAGGSMGWQVIRYQ